MALYLFEVSYYLPATKMGQGGTYVADTKQRVRAMINKIHPRQDRLCDGQDSLIIEQIKEVTLPLKIS
jgi:hypothetical protein